MDHVDIRNTAEFELNRQSRIGLLEAPIRPQQFVEPRITLSFVEVCLYLLSVFVPVVILTGYILDTLGVPLGAITLFLPSVIATFGAFFYLYRQGITFRLQPIELFFGLAGFALIFFYGIWLAWPTLLPIDYVDAMHHYQMIDYIYSHQTLIHGPNALPSPYLNPGTSDYPFASALFMAYLSWTTNLPILFLMHPVASFYCATIALFCYSSVAYLVRVNGEYSNKTGRSGLNLIGSLAGIGSVILLFLPSGYTFTQINEFFFLAQMFGEVWLLALCFWLIRLYPRMDGVFIVPLVLSGLTLITSYTTWFAPFPIALLVLCLGNYLIEKKFIPQPFCPSQLLRPGSSLIRDLLAIRQVQVALIVLLPLGFELLVFTLPRLQTGTHGVTAEGGATYYSLQTMGPLLVYLAAFGLIVALVMYRKTLALLSFALGQAVFMYTVHLTFWLSLTSSYNAQKTWYAAAYFLAILAGFGIGVCAQRLARLSSTKGWISSLPNALKLSVGALLTVILIGYGGEEAVTYATRHQGSHQIPFSTDLYATVTWARDNLPNETFAYVAHKGMVAPWLHLAMLRRSDERPEFAYYVEIIRGFSYRDLSIFDPAIPLPVDNYRDWSNSDLQPNYAIVESLPDSLRPSEELLFRSGKSGVVHRTSTPEPLFATTFPRESIYRIYSDLGVVTPLSTLRYSPGQKIPIQLNLYTMPPYSRPYLVAAHLTDSSGHDVLESSKVILAPSEAEIEEHKWGKAYDLTLSLPGNLPLGIYNVEIIALSLMHQPISISNTVDPSINRLIVGRIAVIPSDSIEVISGLDAPSQPIARLEEGIDLLQASLNHHQASPSGTIGVQLTWRTNGTIMNDYTVFAQLLDHEGKLVTQHDSYPLNGAFPTSLWPVNVLIKDRIDLSMPSGISNGEYRVIVGMYSLETMRRLEVRLPDSSGSTNYLDVGKITITR